MERCWILVGMMGAGKSAVGRALAELSGREFVDTDLLLQNRLGRSIAQLFSIYGETAFREHETKLLKSLEPGPTILSTGGGIVLKDANWNELRRLGTTVYLATTPDVLISRLEKSKKKRPLLLGEGWEEKLTGMLSQREERYRMADITVEIRSEDILEAAHRVHSALVERES